MKNLSYALLAIAVFYCTQSQSYTGVNLAPMGLIPTRVEGCATCPDGKDYNTLGRS